MGLLSKILLAPFTAPIHGALWIGEKVHDAALDAYHDPGAIKAELVRLEKALMAGEISEEEYEAAEMPLLLRLRDARANRERGG